MTRRLPTPPPFSTRVSTVALLAALALAVLPGLFLSGCSNPSSSDDKHQPPPFTLPRTSPENVLYNLRAIYDGADASVKIEADTLQWGEMYQSLFHPDTFTFWFVPGDQPPGWSNTWWGLTDEVNSFQALLLRKVRGTIDDIELTWTVNTSEPDSRYGGDPLHLLHPTWRRVFVTGILLDVVAGQNTYRVPNGTADFYLAPDPANSSLWVITEWVDHQPPPGGSPPGRASLAGANSTTWGAIKGLFY